MSAQVYYFTIFSIVKIYQRKLFEDSFLTILVFLMFSDVSSVYFLAITFEALFARFDHSFGIEYIIVQYIRIVLLLVSFIKHL